MGDKQTPLKSDAYVHAGNTEITPEQILLELKFDPDGAFLSNLARRKIAATIALRRGISVSNQDVESSQIEFFTDRDLFEEEQIAAWLEAMHLGRQQLREHARENVLIERARLELISDEKVADRFAADHHAYEKARVEIFEFGTIGKAREFALAVRENEIKPIGGKSLEMTRRAAPEEIAAELFSAAPGDLIGPIENDDGSFGVFLLREQRDAVLDDDLTNEIRDQLFDELVEAELARAPLRFLK
jgi:hypothetical protein